MILSEEMKRLAFLAGAPIIAQPLNEVTVKDFAASSVRGIGVDEIIPTLQKAYDKLPDELKSRMGFDDFVKYAMAGMEQGAAEEISRMMRTGSNASQVSPEVAPQSTTPQRKEPLSLVQRAKDMTLVPKSAPKLPTRRPDRKLGSHQGFRSFLARQVGRTSGPSQGDLSVPGEKTRRFL